MNKIGFLFLGFLILLFGYSAVSKLIAFDAFADSIHLFEFLNPYTNLIGISVIAIELTTAALLILPNGSRKIGLILSIILLGIYIIYILYLKYFFNVEACGCKILLTFENVWLNSIRNVLLISISGVKSQKLCKNIRRSCDQLV